MVQLVNLTLIVDFIVVELSLLHVYWMIVEPSRKQVYSNMWEYVAPDLLGVIIV